MWRRVRGVTSPRCVASSLTVYFFSPVAQVRLPRSVAIMDWLLLLAFVAGIAAARAQRDRAPGHAGSSRAARRCWSSAPATPASS